MNSKGGIGGTMALVAAVLVGVSYLPRGGGDRGTAGQPQTEIAAPGTVQNKQSPNGPNQTNEACDAISKRLARFVKVIAPIKVIAPDGKVIAPVKVTPPDGRVTAPDGCQETVVQPVQSQTQGGTEGSDEPSGKLEAVIALLPHPLQTHLPLFFDRAVESIQDAAQDEGYAYDSSWFPWDEDQRQYLHLLDEEGSHDLATIRQKQPGVLVFRKSVDRRPNNSYQHGLVVFLVGEQPTGGIDDTEFANALAWVKALDPGNSQPLRILGPTTSGALPSLARALHAQSNLPAWKNRKDGLILYSGTVSSQGSISGFCRDMADLANPVAGTPPCYTGFKAPAAVPLDFRTYEESDAVKTDRLCRYLKLENYKVSRVAFISEDETAYGEQDLPTGCKPDKATDPVPLHLYYPRDISALRSAYEKESIFSSTRPTGNNVPSSTLRGDLTEPASSKHDTVKTYGGELDSLAQESILLDIAGQLRMNQIQYVVLSSSNTMDQVFLAQFLRRSYPEGRVIILGSDLLSLRSAQSVSLRGVMVLSTYPLIPQQQQWTATLENKATNSFHLFGQDSAEALYIAARELIEQGGGAGDSVAPIYDYAPPRWTPVPAYMDCLGNQDPNRPATWLTVIGHQRFWPVAVLNDSTMETRAPCDTMKKPPPCPTKKAQPEPCLSQKTPPEGRSMKLMRTAWACLGNLWQKQEKTVQAFLGNLRPGKETTVKNRCPQQPISALTGSTREQQCQGSEEPAGQHLEFPLPMKILLGAAAIAALCHLALCWCGSLNGPLASFSYFAPVERPQQWCLIFLSSAAVGLGGVVLAIMAGMTRWTELAGKHRLFLFAVCTIALGAPCGAVFLSWGKPRIQPPPPTARKNLHPERRVHPGLYPLLGLVLLLLAYAGLLHVGLISHLLEANRYPTFWRSVNLFSGVSPLMPQVLFLVGLYFWCWFNLKGLTLMGEDRPYLPPPGSMLPIMRLFSRQLRQTLLEKLELPLGGEWIRRFGLCLVVVVLSLRISLRYPALGSLGELTFGRIIFGWLALLSAMVLADAWQVLATWKALHELLSYLDRLRLRRTFAALRGLCWGSVWKMSGSPLEERYHVLSRQFESLSNLQNELKNVRAKRGMSFFPTVPAEDEPLAAALAAVTKCLHTGEVFADWYVGVYDTEESRGVGFCDRLRNQAAHGASPRPGVFKRLLNQMCGNCVPDIIPMVRFQKQVAYTTGKVMTLILLPWWHTESDSLIFDKSLVQADKADKNKKKDEGDVFSPSVQVPDYVRAAEELVAVTYLAFIQNTLGRIRTIVFGMLAVFVAMTLGIASYPFEPLPMLGGFFLALFVVAGGILVIVYGAMYRDTILSYVTNTNPGELGWSFWGQLIAFAATPLFALLTTLFPSFADFLLSWVQPSAGVLK